MKVELVNWEIGKKTYNYHSTYEWIGSIGNVIKLTIEVKENSKRKMKDPNNFLSKKKQDRVKDN